MHGRLATLFKVKDKKHFLALSELAGSKLSNIVVETYRNGNELIKSNAFRSRINLIPMDGVVVKMLEKDVIDYYHQISEGRARLAIELIEFDPKFTKVMQFAFG